MRRSALVRLALGGGMLLLLLGVVTACGGGGAAEKKATPESPIASEPGWLAYQTDPGDLFSIKLHLVRVDGSQDHAIATKLSGAVRHPDFSPDGSRLAFDQLAPEESAYVYVARGDGSNAKRLSLESAVPGRGEYWQPAWSPDGSRLAVSTDAGPIGEFGPARFGLAIVDVDSKEVTQVLDHKSAEGQDQFASWSPDGKRLAFYRVRSKSGQDQVQGIGQTAVFVVNIDGSGLRQLTPWNMLAGDSDWSPKGDLIAFSTRPLLNFTSGRSELYTIRPDGSGMRALTSHGADGPRATQPQWTPDGEAILYTRANQSLTTRHVWAIDRTGGKDAPVLTEESAYTQPVLQPR